MLATIEHALGLPALGGAADPRAGSLTGLFARPPSVPCAAAAVAHPHPNDGAAHLEWRARERSEHPLIPDREVDPRRELPAMELEVLARWRERDVFAASLQAREGAERWVFYEGPPTANGPPGSHHVLSRVFKDIYPRFQTMRGYRVERKGGWDCHGLPVEIAVEQQLGHQIEGRDRGVRDRALQRAVPRVGVHVPRGVGPADRADRLLARPRARLPDARRELHRVGLVGAVARSTRRGLLYEGHKVVPYCPRCETTLSSHEVALGYRDVVDPSVFLKLHVPAGEERLLVWTTTPWTLPGQRRAWRSRPRPIYATGALGGRALRAGRGSRRGRARRGRRDPRAASRAPSWSSAIRAYEGRSSPPTDREPGRAADPRATTS